MLVYVPQRRNPAAARSWLLLIFVLPWPGLVPYAFFGRAYMTRQRVAMQAEISKFIQTTGMDFLSPYIAKPELSPQFQHVVTLAQNLGDFPILAGNHVDLIPSYQGAIDRLIADI